VQLNLYQFAGTSQWSTAAGKGVQSSGTSRYCVNKVALAGRTPSERAGDYFQFDIPLAEFNCGTDVAPNKVDVLLAGGGSNYRFCMDDVKVY
jgi:hypothetical protein